VSGRRPPRGTAKVSRNAARPSRRPRKVGQRAADWRALQTGCRLEGCRREEAAGELPGPPARRPPGILMTCVEEERTGGGEKERVVVSGRPGGSLGRACCPGGNRLSCRAGQEPGPTGRAGSRDTGVTGRGGVLRFPKQEKTVRRVSSRG
jgi:hypothetical protein